MLTDKQQIAINSAIYMLQFQEFLDVLLKFYRKQNVFLLTE